MSFPQWQPGQASPEVPVNEAFDILKFLSVFGRDPETTSGLTWGYLGGPWGGLTITAGTVSLTASNTNYIVADRTTGVVSVSTSTTNWNNTSTYARIYSVVAGVATTTSFVDYRGAPQGVLGPRTVVVTGLPAGTDGDLLRYNGVSEEWEPATLEDVLPTATTGDALVFNGTVWEAAEVTGGGGGSSKQTIVLELSKRTESVTASTGYYTIYAPFNLEILDVKLSSEISGNDQDLIIDINKGATSIFTSTDKLVLDAFILKSADSALPYAFNSTPVLFDENDTIRIDVDQASNALGVKLYLIVIPT